MRLPHVALLLAGLPGGRAAMLAGCGAGGVARGYRRAPPRIMCDGPPRPRASQLRAELARLGVPTDGVFERDELERLLDRARAEAAARKAEARAAPPSIEAMAVQEVMDELEARGVRFDVLAPEEKLASQLRRARAQDAPPAAPRRPPPRRPPPRQPPSAARPPDTPPATPPASPASVDAESAVADAADAVGAAAAQAAKVAIGMPGIVRGAVEKAQEEGSVIGGVAFESAMSLLARPTSSERKTGGAPHRPRTSHTPPATSPTHHPHASRPAASPLTAVKPAHHCGACGASCDRRHGH